MSQRYESAHELYSEAIGMADAEDAETKACLLANRAAALMNLGRDTNAIRDCEKVSFSCWSERARRVQCG